MASLFDKLRYESERRRVTLLLEELKAFNEVDLRKYLWHLHHALSPEQSPLPRLPDAAVGMGYESFVCDVASKFELLEWIRGRCEEDSVVVRNFDHVHQICVRSEYLAQKQGSTRDWTRMVKRVVDGKYAINTETWSLPPEIDLTLSAPLGAGGYGSVVSGFFVREEEKGAVRVAIKHIPRVLSSNAKTAQRCVHIPLAISLESHEFSLLGLQRSS